jgi:hypothetical protein
MATTMGTISNSMMSVANRNVKQQKSEKTHEQPERNTETVDTQTERTDTVEITNTRYLGKASEKPYFEDRIEDIDAAMGKVEEIKAMIAADHDASQAEQMHDINRSNLVVLLA